MATPRETIEKVENIARHGTGEIKNQMKAIAEAVIALDKHQRQLEENLQAVLIKINQIVAKISG